MESARPGGRAVVVVRTLFAAETGEYFLLLGTTLFLVVFGLVMVLSSSSIESGAKDGDFFGRFLRQGTFALIGVPVMLILARLPVAFWRRVSWWVLGASLALQLLVFVPGLRYGNGYNTNWIKIGPVTAQPSEFIKFALIVWAASVLTTKRDRLDSFKHVVIPVIPVAGVAIALVLGGGDLGTAMIMFAIVIGTLFFAGIRLRYVIGFLIAAGAISLLLAKARSSRANRLESFLNGCSDASKAGSDCYQTLHGWWALADGGVFGVGLGNSTLKWKWLPEVDNDFIFAMIGNELGLVGAVIVLLVFAVLAVSFVRIMRMQRDRFPVMVIGGVLVWIIGQAFVNIAVVLGLLPVLGVPLPLVSAGGTALVGTLAAIGVVLSFARRHPEDELA